MGRSRARALSRAGRPTDAALTDDRHRRSNRVLVSQLAGTVTLVGPEAHHLRDVLRLKPGAPVEAFDGHGNVARGEIGSVGRDAVELRLSSPVASQAEAAVKLTLATALLKGDKLAEVVRPATELGVHRFVLLSTVHADVDDLPPSRRSRLERIAQEAARQCGRATVPEIYGPVSLSELLAMLTREASRSVIVVADPRATDSLVQARAALEAAGHDSAVGRPSAVVVTGPEGGLSATEVDALKEAGALAIGLGPRILRAETAPVALAAALLLGVA